MQNIHRAAPTAILFSAALVLAACSHSKSGPADFAASPGAGGEASAASSSAGRSWGGAPAAESAGPAPASAPPMHTEYERGGGGDATVSADADVVATRSRGLGTAYGETRRSEVQNVTFTRRSDNPDALLQLRYNEPEGIRDLTQLRGGVAAQPAIASHGALRVSLLDERGAALPGVDVAGQRYAIGRAGERYTIGISNDTGARYEVVAAVDGLDVIDGRDASFAKRGYVVDPYTSFVIDGWRTSDSTTAAFRFSGLEESYAGQTGRPRNIGVIGVAFFQERVIDTQELHRRDTADPFPGRYAPPPPRRY